VQVRDAAGSRHLYPALRDEGETVTLRYYADRTEAERVHAGGVLRLAVLALAQPCKYLRKTFGGRPELALGAAYGTSGSLVDDLVRRTIADVMQAPDDPPIRREEEFRRRLDERRSSVVLRGSTLAELVVDILQRRQALAARLDEGLKGPGAAAAAEAIREQLAALVPAGFLRTVPAPWLGELPRYLRAAEARIDKLATGNARDAQMEAQVTPFEARLSTVDDAEAQPELTRYRWLIEEFRVSLFAQSLGTREKVSAARLEQQWQRVLVAARRAH
jgi:ATP-dependent helicase HrpA